jgi:pantoate--beta-alanine ligase
MTRPVVAATVEAVREAVGAARRRGQTVGLVPTMGALHAGHVSLIQAARAECSFVVLSLFVNPTQFGAGEDFTRYPRPLAADLAVCAREGVDLVFAPEPATIYPPGFRTHVEVEGLQDVLEGASRPGHFRGVATVVLKLFTIVGPDAAFFGQKDVQQTRIVRQLTDDLNVPVRLRVCPTVREPDGLALSSRNQYLDPDQRRHATVLFQALREAERLIEQDERDPAVVRRALADRIEKTPGAHLDYAAVVDALTFQPAPSLQGDIVLALAVKFGSTRLIDNLILHLGVRG